MGRTVTVLLDDDHRIGSPRVRDARVDDGAAIGAILAELGWFDGDADAFARRATHLIPDAGDPNRSLLVAEYAGDVAGYLQVSWLQPLFLAGPEAYVSELFVGARFRGRGVGSALLDAVHARARDLGVTRVRLIGNREREHYRRDFYPSRGYETREQLLVFDRPIGDGG